MIIITEAFHFIKEEKEVAQKLAYAATRPSPGQ